MPNLMLESTFSSMANGEPLTTDRGLKFTVDFENATLNVPCFVVVDVGLAKAQSLISSTFDLSQF